MHISKKRVRLAIMDALDEVLKNDAYTRLSKGTKITIVEAVEKITESVQGDFNGQGEAVTATAHDGRATTRNKKSRKSSSRTKE